jgi:hypothetical protein
MANSQKAIQEFEELRGRSAVIRSDSVHSQIESVFTFCDLADFEAQHESPMEARKMLITIKRAMAKINHHLVEPNHIAPDRREGLRTLAGKAENRVRQLERKIR